MVEPAAIKSIKGLSTTEDGKAVSFVIETDDGTETPLKCMTHDLDKFVQPFINIAQFASTKMSREDLQALAPTEQVVANPIPASRIGVGEGRHPTEIFLGVHLGTLALWFSLEATELKKLETVIRQLVPHGTMNPQ